MSRRAVEPMLFAIESGKVLHMFLIGKDPNWDYRALNFASRFRDGKIDRTRPLCPYPQGAVYGGTGSTDDAANFICKARWRIRDESQVSPSALATRLPASVMR
jgi:hypothetical protein